tara:strand:- start:790 stop:2529 length:1740 start_codon:yes stop_codon:yes gene_type:complete
MTSAKTSCCRPDRATLLALVVCLVFGFFMARGVSMGKSMGYDEAMHVQWPAARIGLAFADSDPMGGMAAIHDCSQYPPVYPIVLAGVQGLFGITEFVARSFGRWFWAFGCFGLFLLTREVLRGRREEGDESCGLAPWLALGLAMLSPMAIAFSGMLFLEIPWLVVAIFTVLVWLRRRRLGGWYRDLFAGAMIAIAFFTKFNYGVLLGFALFVDLVIETISGIDDKNPRARIWPALRVGLPITIAMLWWFGIPIPQGSAVAAEHRFAFKEFLFGNQEMARMPVNVRVLLSACSLVRSPLILILALVGLGASLRDWRSPAIRTLWIVFLSITIPIATHNFHLDRFQLPPSGFLWVLAAIGWAGLLPKDAAPRMGIGGGLLLFVAAACTFPAEVSWRTLSMLGLAQEDPAIADVQRETLRRMSGITPGRFLDTNGMVRSEHDALVAEIENSVYDIDRIGWIGMNTSFCPAVPLLALHAKGHPVARQLRSSELDRSFVTLAYVPPPAEDWTDEKLAAWAAQFTVIFGTYPVDLNRQDDRMWLHDMRERLVHMDWSIAEPIEFQHIKGPGDEYKAAFLVMRKFK